LPGHVTPQGVTVNRADGRVRCEPERAGVSRMRVSRMRARFAGPSGHATRRNRARPGCFRTAVSVQRGSPSLSDAGHT
jgi:hypothetical protein